MNSHDIEELFLGVAEIIKEKRELEEENYYLRKKLKEQDSRIDLSYKHSTDRVANILNIAIENAYKDS